MPTAELMALYADLDDDDRQLVWQFARALSQCRISRFHRQPTTAEVVWQIFPNAPRTHVRGRSLQNTYCSIEESQNLTPHEVNTVITRAAEGTKIALSAIHYRPSSTSTRTLHYVRHPEHAGLTLATDLIKFNPIEGSPKVWRMFC